MDSTSTQSLYRAQEQFLGLMGEAEPLGLGIILCGGTALARVYLNHRVSYDLDFFVEGAFDPDRLAVALARLGVVLEDVQMESGGRFVHQLVGFTAMHDVRLKVSFIEDSYAGMFPNARMLVGESPFRVEAMDGLYHRKLRTVSGSSNGDLPNDGRQAARDLFDLFILDSVHSIPQFVPAINRHGANFPLKAFLAGLAAMPWIDMMDDFAQMDVNPTHPSLLGVNPADRMAMVRLRMQEVFREMA